MSSLDSDDARSLLITAREEAVRLAELMAAHRDGQMSSDCSDIDEPGACDTCNTLDAAIKAISQLTALRQERDSIEEQAQVAYRLFMAEMTALRQELGGFEGMTRIYCDVCKMARPLVVDRMPADALNNHDAADLLCGECRSIVTTLHALPPSPTRTGEAP